MSKFKRENDFDKRKKEAERIRDRYPGRIPIIVEKDERSDIEDIDKNKFLVPHELDWAKFISVIRKRIQLGPEKGLFIFVNNTMLNSTEKTIGQIYEEYRDSDGFIYTQYSGESVYG